jgi:hypothetical protein
MRRRTDQEIQAFLDRGGSAADADGWEREELLDLHAYALIDEILAEEPDFALPPSFADAMADRLMPKVVAPVEGILFGVLLAVFAITGAILAIGSLPLVFAGAGRMLAPVATHGRPDVVLAVAAMLAGILLLERLLPAVWQQPGRTRPSS